MTTAKNIWLKRNPNRIFDVSTLSPSNPLCAVCRVVYAPVAFVPSLTLGEFVSTLIGADKPVNFACGPDALVSITEGSRLVYETEEFEDNAGREMRELGLGEGKFVTVETEEDEEGKGRWPVVFCVAAYVLLFFPLSFLSRWRAADEATGE
jgi:ubiquitin-like 1-activating enzyme E1 B